MKSVLRGVTLFVGVSIALSIVTAVGSASAQTGVNISPSRETLDEVARASCDGVSVVVQRCAAKPDEAADKTSPDALKRSRANAKAAFDRRDSRGRADALNGVAPASNTPVGGAQRLDTVTVQGKSPESLSIEQVLQRALNPNTDGVLSSDGKTISHYGLNGSRYDCVAKCVGPACCIEVRALPNPARESNSIGR